MAEMAEMAENEFSRDALREALAKVKSLPHIPQETQDALCGLINLILNLPNEPRRLRGEPARHWSELSFDDFASLPTTPGDSVTALQFLLQELENALGQMEWLNFLRHNGLVEE